MFKFIRNNLGPFLAGIFFTVFVLLVIAVVYLYSVNAGLRREIANFQKKLGDVEIKVTPSSGESPTQESMQVDTPTATYYVQKKSPNLENTKPIGSNEPNKNPSYSQNYSAKEMPKTGIESEQKSTIESTKSDDLIYSLDNWLKLKKNMTRDQVKELIGTPSQVISFIDSSSYIYRYSSGEGVVTFSRLNKVIGWRRP